VRSAACNLHATTKQQLVQRGEESVEMGGYFIVNGIERIIRLLIAQRRHYIMGMVRGAYSRRGPTFTEFATAIRCVARDESSMTVRVHYMTNGSARVSFVLRRQEFFIPARARACAARRLRGR
jgi:DNA-directed RNA polymerase I subunit RPA2